MKATLWFAALTMAFAVPKSFGMTELEALRAKCARQEQEIRRLEAQVRQQQPKTGDGAVPAISASPSASTYVVKKGDSLERIARRNGCSARALCKANGLKSSAIIHPGQRLKLPGRPVQAAQVAAATTAAKPAQVTSPTRASSGGTHKVMQGETFSSISRKHRISLAALLAANPDVKPTQLRPGQTIRLDGAPISKPVTNPTVRETAVASVAPSVPRPVATPPVTTSTTISTHATPVAMSAPVAATASAAGGGGEAAPAPQPSVPAPVTSATKAQVDAAPQPAPAPAPIETIESSPAPNTEKKIRSVTIEGEMTYGEFAAKHGTDPDRLNDLNGLDLTHATVLAKGSELYVPAQP